MTTEVPSWLQNMIDSGQGKAEGLRWLSAEERASAAQKKPPSFAGKSLWMSNEMATAANESWQNKLMVGVGPETYWDHAVSSHMEIWLDQQAPDKLWVAFQHQPPFLWMPAGQSAETLLSTIKSYLPTDLAQPRKHLTPRDMIVAQRQSVQGAIPGAAPGQDRHTRLMVGIALAQSNLGLSEIENHFISSGFCDFRFLMQGTAQGNTNVNPTVTVVRTLYSRSNVRLDWYDSLSGTLFADVYYTPAGQDETVRAVNEKFDLHYPLDIPVDVPTLLLGLEAISASRLKDQISRRLDDPPRLQFYLYCLAILTNPNIAEHIQPYINHPSPLIRELLRTMLAQESDPELRAKIESSLKNFGG